MMDRTLADSHGEVGPVSRGRFRPAFPDPVTAQRISSAYPIEYASRTFVPSSHARAGSSSLAASTSSSSR